jgi:hypothetical protein
MTAGRGIIHSEMPLQESGRLHGFQFWINLPAKEKMKPAAYRDIQPEEIPEVTIDGGSVKVVAGRLETADGRTADGPIQGLSTAPLFLDVRLEAGARFTQSVAGRALGLPVSLLGQSDVWATARDVPFRIARPGCCPTATASKCRPARMEAISCCWQRAPSASRWCSTAPS